MTRFDGINSCSKPYPYRRRVILISIGAPRKEQALEKPLSREEEIAKYANAPMLDMPKTQKIIADVRSIIFAMGYFSARIYCVLHGSSFLCQSVALFPLPSIPPASNVIDLRNIKNCAAVIVVPSVVRHGLDSTSWTTLSVFCPWRSFCRYPR